MPHPVVSNKHLLTQRHSKQRVQSGCLKRSRSHLSKSQLRRSPTSPSWFP